MRAARVQSKNGKYTIVAADKPNVKAGHVLIEMKAAGFCHTDILTSQGFFGDKFPITGSHEAAGVVAQVGEGVEDLKVGDRVIALNQVHQCGECWDCRHADPAYCEKSQLAGLHADGCFSDFWQAMARNTIKIPDSLAFEKAAPLTCAGISIFGAIRKAGLEPGQVLAISGIGALGHIGVQIAKAMGLFTVAIDARSGRLDMCRHFKHAPDLYVNAAEISAEATRKMIRDARAKVGLSNDRPEGADAVILTAEPDMAITYAIDVLARHGTAVVVAQPDLVKIRSVDFIFKHIKVCGSLQGGPDLLRETADFVAQNDIEIVIKTWSLDDVNKLWEHQESTAMIGKNVVTF